MSQDQPLGKGHLLGNFVRVTGSLGNDQTREKAEGWVTKEATAVTRPAVGMPRLQHQGQKRKSPGFGDARGPWASKRKAMPLARLPGWGRAKWGVPHESRVRRAGRCPLKMGRAGDTALGATCSQSQGHAGKGGCDRRRSKAHQKLWGAARRGRQKGSCPGRGADLGASPAWRSWPGSAQRSEAMRKWPVGRPPQSRGQALVPRGQEGLRGRTEPCLCPVGSGGLNLAPR